MKNSDKNKKIDINRDDLYAEDNKAERLKINLPEIEVSVTPPDNDERISGIYENEKLIVDEQDATLLNSRSSFSITKEDLKDKKDLTKLSLDFNHGSLENHVLKVVFCPGCGGEINSTQELCLACYHRLRSTDETPSKLNDLKKIGMWIAASIAFLLLTVVGAGHFLSSSNIQATVPVTETDYIDAGDYSTAQVAINEANDGDVITLERLPYYGPLDFEGKNLTLRFKSDINLGADDSDLTKVAVSGAIITLVNAAEIEAILKSYTIAAGNDSDHKNFVYDASSNYYDHRSFPGTYIALEVKGKKLLIKGQATEGGTWIKAIVDSGTFKGEYISKTENKHFEILLTPVLKQKGIRQETVLLNVQQSDKRRGSYKRFYSNLMIDLHFDEEGLQKVKLTPSLAYSGNARAWNTFREPSRYLDNSYRIQSDDPEIVEKANLLVKKTMTDYEKFVVIHDWVTTNIAYDVHYKNTGERAPQDAVSVLEQKVAVCAGYANIMAALLRSQGIPVRYVSGYALGSHDSGIGWEDEGLYGQSVGHAWNEVYIDGEWITVDATWNAGYIDSSSGEFVFDQSFRYFAPSVEFFSRSHFIPGNR